MVLIREKIKGDVMLMPKNKKDIDLFKHCIGVCINMPIKRNDTVSIREKEFLLYYTAIFKIHCDYVIEDKE